MFNKQDGFLVKRSLRLRFWNLKCYLRACYDVIRKKKGTYISIVKYYNAVSNKGQLYYYITNKGNEVLHVDADSDRTLFADMFPNVNQRSFCILGKQKGSYLPLMYKDVNDAMQVIKDIYNLPELGIYDVELFIKEVMLGEEYE